MVAPVSNLVTGLAVVITGGSLMLILEWGLKCMQFLLVGVLIT